MEPNSIPARRVEALDVARGLALVAMAIYHFAWDLEFFGYVPPAMTAVGGWKLFARCIASSFLFMVGFSLVLAHARGFRPRPFLIRLAMVAGAAAAISLVTWIAVRSDFIFFGILHQIALASVLGLAFLRLPWFATAAVAAAVIALPAVFPAPLFDTPALWWVGLSTQIPHSNDYVPLFPWFGAVLLGMAAAQLLAPLGLVSALAVWQPGRAFRPLIFAGRHSLAVYLIHQPVLIACVWLAAQAWPAPQRAPQEAFTPACIASCGQSRDDAFCPAYCGCVLDRLVAEDRLDDAFGPVQSADTEAQLNEIAAACTVEADGLTAPQDGEGDDEP